MILPSNRSWRTVLLRLSVADTLMTFIPGPTSPPEAAAMSDTGKYVQHWQRVAGRWQLVRAIWNSDRAQP